ncbi:hypothetical protein [Streptomyces sp. NPDC017991]|uniref:hypothetical protein n=1 Tax=Streptomyces sp. NPDC017991 TaxID=3365026 RepID=UPI00378BB6D7
MTYHRLHLAALRGRRQEALDLFETATATVTPSGAGQQIADAHWAAAVLHNGLVEYPAALAAARRVIARSDLYLIGLTLPEPVQAAVRCGEHGTAAEALESLTERTEAAGTSSGPGIAAYARGLVTEVEDHYREAVKHLEDSPPVP